MIESERRGQRNHHTVSIPFRNICYGGIYEDVQDAERRLTELRRAISEGQIGIPLAGQARVVELVAGQRYTPFGSGDKLIRHEIEDIS